MIEMIIDKTLGVVSRRWSQRRSVQHELERLKQSLRMTAVVNNLDAPLSEFRQFFQQNPELVGKHKANSDFVERWLMDPYLQAFGSVPGMWTRERFNQLRADTIALCA